MMKSWSNDEIEARLSKLVETHPTMASLTSSGTSVGGRDIMGLFELFTPDGKPWHDIPQSVLSRNGVACYQDNLPLNAPSGEWTVVAREAISRRETSKSFRL